ncbi:hypothetical protein BsWGS_08577 [Bradybaena similaris]
MKAGKQHHSTGRCHLQYREASLLTHCSGYVPSGHGMG